MTTSPPGSEARAGFTLVELIIICVILAILLAASVPRLQPAAQRLRTEQTAVGLAQWLRLARERAVSESRAIVWGWHEDARRVRLELVPEDGAAADDEAAQGEALLPSQGPAVSADVAIEVLRDGEAVACRCVRFFPDGTSESAVITVDSAAARYAITVHEATGDIVLEPRRAES